MAFCFFFTGISGLWELWENNALEFSQIIRVCVILATNTGHIINVELFSHTMSYTSGHCAQVLFFYTMLTLQKRKNKILVVMVCWKAMKNSLHFHSYILQEHYYEHGFQKSKFRRQCLHRGTLLII